MKIFFLINTLRSGGAQQALVSVLENFSLKYFQVFLIVIDRKNKIDSKIYNKNIKIIYLNEKLNNFIKIYIKLFKILRQHGPKYLVSTGNAETIIYSRLVSFIIKIKHISWIQFDYTNSIPFSYFKKVIWTIFFRYFYFTDYKIILISNYLSKRYKEKLNWKSKRIIIIPNTFNKIYLNKFKKVKVRKKIILCPGRLDYDKNHLKIIPALKKLKDKINNIICIFIGEKGNAYSKILENIRVNKLEKNIKILNYVKSDKFLKILNNSYLVLLLSKKEPFGVIALETIYLKTNFLISYTSGFKDILRGVKGRNIIKNYNNYKEIFKKTYNLYTKPMTNKEKMKFYNNSLSKFETKNIFRKWLKVFK